MRANALKGSQKIESASLNKLNIDNMNLKSLCSRTFDSVMHLIYILEFVACDVRDYRRQFGYSWKS